MAGVFLSVLLGLAGAAPAAGPKAQPLRLRAEAQPRVAQPGQPVSVVVRWFAAGGPVLINRRGLLGREVTIVVRRRGGPALALTTPPDLGAPKEHDFLSLAPGAPLEYDYPLLPASGKPLPPGRYDVRVVYRNEAALPGQKPFLGVLEAKTSFRVRPVLVK